MERISLIFVFVSLCTSCGLSQLSLYKGKYKKFLQAGETEVYTDYCSVTSKKLEDEMVYRKFFPETKQITHYVEIDQKSKQKNGLYKEWYDDGTLIIDGQYLDDEKTGTWYIHDKGSGEYINGKKQGKWVSKYEKGQVSSFYHYRNDKLDGDFIIYDTLGNITNQGVYRDDTIFTQTKVKDPNKKEIMPMFAHTCISTEYEEKQKCAEKAMLNHIYKTLKYPYFAREAEIQGQAITTFVVGKDGNIENIQVLRGLCQSIKEEVIRMIKSFPTWTPGYQDGKPVKVVYTIPIMFNIK